MSYLNELQRKRKDDLVNTIYNNFIRDVADFNVDDDSDVRGFGKRIPYIGWFWRSADFVGKNISIGDCGDLIGVMENNKWNYPERLLTDEEAQTFIDFIDRAHAESRKGGSLGDILKKRDGVLEDLWNWMQTLSI